MLCSSYAKLCWRWWCIIVPGPANTTIFVVRLKVSTACGETPAWRPLTSHTSSERQRVMQRTRRWREKSILSFHSATGLRAATERWARGLSKIHTCLAGSKASGPCVFQRNCWGKRFLWQHPFTWQYVLACLSVFAPSQPQLNIPLHQFLSSLVAKMACGPLVSSW